MLRLNLHYICVIYSLPLVFEHDALNWVEVYCVENTGFFFYKFSIPYFITFNNTN